MDLAENVAILRRAYAWRSECRRMALPTSQMARLALQRKRAAEDARDGPAEYTHTRAGARTSRAIAHRVIAKRGIAPRRTWPSTATPPPSDARAAVGGREPKRTNLLARAPLPQLTDCPVRALAHCRWMADCPGRLPQWILAE